MALRRKRLLTPGSEKRKDVLPSHPFGSREGLLGKHAFLKVGPRAAVGQPGRRGKGTWAALGAGARDAGRRGSTAAPEGQPRGRRQAGGLGEAFTASPAEGPHSPAEAALPHPLRGLPAARPSPRAVAAWVPAPFSQPYTGPVAPAAAVRPSLRRTGALKRPNLWSALMLPHPDPRQG